MTTGGKKQCCECDLKAKSLRPIVLLASGQILYVCKQCWARLDYGEFLKK